MSKQEDTAALERQVRPWLEKMRIPQQNYMNLPPYYKILLHGRVCGGTHLSDKQLRDLYGKLLISESRAEECSTAAVDFVTNE